MSPPSVTFTSREKACTAASVLRINTNSVTSAPIWRPKPAPPVPMADGPLQPFLVRATTTPLPPRPLKPNPALVAVMMSSPLASLSTACGIAFSGTAWKRSISWVRFLEACFGFCSGVMVAGMSDYRHKRHNVSSLLYHIVCPAKYRRVIFDAEVDTVLKDVCLDIAKRYEIAFLEIGTDKDHVHFLVQSVPSYS